MTYARKTDGNHNEIVNHLRKIPGVTVFDVSRFGHGLPDIIVGFRRRTYLFEIKTAKGTLTDSELVFFETWTGHATIIRSLDDALIELGLI